MNSVGPPRVITLDALRRFTSSSSRVEVGRSVAKACPCAIEQIFKQHNRARSSTHQAADPTDARIQRFDSAVVTISGKSGNRAMQKIQKHQFKTVTLGGRSATMPEVWNARAGRLIRISEIPRAHRPRTNFAPESKTHVVGPAPFPRKEGGCLRPLLIAVYKLI
jgi:hypothetical protein